MKELPQLVSREAKEGTMIKTFRFINLEIFCSEV